MPLFTRDHHLCKGTHGAFSIQHDENYNALLIAPVPAALIQSPAGAVRLVKQCCRIALSQQEEVQSSSVQLYASKTLRSRPGKFIVARPKHSPEEVRTST